MSDENTELKIHITSDADNAGFKSAANAAQDLNKEMGVVNVSQEDANRITDKATETTEHLTVKKGDLREALRSLGREFPQLAELARAALNPIVFLVAAPIAAFEIFKSRVDAAQTALSEVEMPDLTSGIEQARALRQEWDGIAAAVAKANDEFNSPGSVYGRRTSAIDKKFDSEKKLLALQKEHALANLESLKGSMSGGEYTIAKTSIENYYTEQEYRKEKEANDQKLAAVYEERLLAQKQSEAAAKKAAGIKLPQDDAEVAAQLDALRKRQAARKDDEDKAQAELDKINVAKESIGSGNFYEKFKAGFGLYYNYGSDAESIDDIVGDRVKRAQEDQINIGKEIARREKLQKSRQGFRDEAAKDAGLATSISLELPGDYAAWQRENRTNATVNQGQQQINAQTAITQIKADGINFAQVTEDLNLALALRDKNIIQELRRLASQMNHTPLLSR